MMSALNSCKNSQKSEPSKDLCYGAHMEYFIEGNKYSTEQENAVIANCKFVCNSCLDSLTNKEQADCKEFDNCNE